MKRICTLLAATVLVGAAATAGPPAALAAPSPSPAPSPSATPSSQLAGVTAQLDAAQATLNDLNDQVERAQAALDDLNRRLADDQKREAAVRQDLMSLARVEYEQPAFSLSSILQATSLDQLLGNIAQARLVASKQQGMLAQAQQLRRQDEDARRQMSGHLVQVQAARDQAAQVAIQALALRNSIQDAALRARAAAVNAQAQATQVGVGASAGPWPNHFAFGYCTWYVATRRYVPWFGNANQWYVNARPYGFPEGQTPKVGAIMVTNESAFGHVAYVEAVNKDGSWVVSEMNYVAWDVVDRRTILPGQVPLQGFIYG